MKLIPKSDCAIWRRVKNITYVWHRKKLALWPHLNVYKKDQIELVCLTCKYVVTIKLTSKVWYSLTITPTIISIIWICSRSLKLTNTRTPTNILWYSAYQTYPMGAFYLETVVKREGLVRELWREKEWSMTARKIQSAKNDTRTCNNPYDFPSRLIDSSEMC